VSRLIAWLGRVVFVLGVVVALGFGLQQAVASGSAVLEDCDQYCPNDTECAKCCLRAGGSGGECVGPGKLWCMCIG
jgi:hypothetical protein